MSRPFLLTLAAVLAAAAVGAAAPPKKKPAPAPAKKPAAAAPAALLSGPMDVLLLERQKRVRLSHTELESGALGLVFDGNPRTYARAATAPAPAPRQAYCQIMLDAPRVVDEVNVAFGESSAHRWSLSAADTPADMQGQKGSYRILVPPRTPNNLSGDQAAFKGARAYKIWRLECERVAGEGGVALAEWSLWTPQKLAVMEIAVPIPEVGRGSLLPMRANGTFDMGGRQNMTPDVTWVVSPPSRGTVDAFSRFEAREAGPARVVAVYGGIRSKPLDLVIHPEARPDWTVTYIERNPRLNYESADRLKPGQAVSWIAHVKNYGTGEAPPVAVEWRIDGKPLRPDRLPKIPRFGQSEALLSLPWDGQRHEIELVVDPQNQVAETVEGNNSRKVFSDALSVGFWVEESLAHYFHRNQRALGTGANSWEDWAQRQIDFWNQSMDNAVPTGAGDAARERWRLDKIVYVSDGLLPLAGGSPVSRPDGRERTVHLTVGFPAYEASFKEQYHRTTERTPDNPFYVQQGLLQALEGVRYHQLAYRPGALVTRSRVRPAPLEPEPEAPRAPRFDRRMRPPR